MPKGAKFGGRAKGTRNKSNQVVEDIAAKLKCNPFEILCRFANGDWENLGYDSAVYVREDAKGGTTIGWTISPELRMNAAKEAVKYLHAQKKQVELKTDPDGGGIKIILEDYTTKKA